MGWDETLWDMIVIGCDTMQCVMRCICNEMGCDRMGWDAIEWMGMDGVIERMLSSQPCVN
jgi:hypothetical protein